MISCQGSEHSDLEEPEQHSDLEAPEQPVIIDLVSCQGSEHSDLEEPEQHESLRELKRPREDSPEQPVKRVKVRFHHIAP